MKKGLIGKKLGMTHVYDSNGVMVPVTVIELGPCPVLAVKTQDKDGYSAIQLGFGVRKEKNVTKALKGNFKKAGIETDLPALIKEVRLDSDPEVKVGDKVIVGDTFAADEFVDVIGQTKGHGFKGVVARWGFNGGRASHGGAWTRRTGSIGMCASPGKVYNGRKMPGHMGDVRRTVQNLKVVSVRPEENLIFVKGAIPGCTGGVVIVRNAVKK